MSLRQALPIPSQQVRPATATIGLAQAAYYLLTGLWPLAHMATFLAITGRKTDLWLVRTVAVLVCASGAALGAASLRREITVSTAVLAIGSALGLTAIDVVYVAKRRISAVYLLDAVVELLLCGAWLLAWRRAGGETPVERLP